MPSLRNLSPTLHASAALHVGAVVALAAGVQWPWAAAAVLTNHALLTGIGLWPRSTLLGPNMLRLSAAQQDSRQVAITIDDGPNPQVTPAVLDILDTWQAKASFFCIGKAVQTYPELAREIVCRGHRVENHSYSHRHYFSLMGIGTLRNEISQAQDVISQITGQQPVYFRAPAVGPYFERPWFDVSYVDTARIRHGHRRSAYRAAAPNVQTQCGRHIAGA
jgi:peptidoglycan-N-acetylglucosamine deacetylase